MENTANVRYVRPEAVAELAKWKMIRDCLAGQDAIKNAGDVYLPRPNAEDKTAENKARYRSYITRAVFYNTTRRTLDGLVGQVFVRDPVVTLPAQLEALEGDVDGAGVSIYEQSKKVLSDTMSFGRVGLLTDYPVTNGVVTRTDEESGFIRPHISVYQPESILNWRTIVVGGKRLLSLVVLQELVVLADDGFQPTFGYQWRVLRLVPVDGASNSFSEIQPITQYEYHVDLWQELIPTTGTAPEINKTSQNVLVSPINSYVPLDANGKPLSEIPFVFVGSTNNDSDVDPSPLYDLAVLNVGHYRNSADYEEACFFVGQPTVYASGLTEDWVNNVMKGAVRIGSRTLIPLPVGGTAGMLQVNPNTLPKEAMDQKEKQMVALGARLVEQRNVQQTLGEAQQKEAAQTSILASVAKNVGSAYTRCLKWCTLFTSADNTEIEFELNTDFIASRMTPEERAELIAEWQAGAISFTEMRTQLHKAGVATEEDEVAKAEATKDELRVDPLKKAAIDQKADPNMGRVAPMQNSKTQA